MRRATPPPATAQAMPSRTVTSRSAACGRQKQFCPGQAPSVLYWPMKILPPRVGMTCQSASMKTQPSPNHRVRAPSTPNMMVSEVLYQLLNRLSRTHDAAPDWKRGGGRTG